MQQFIDLYRRSFAGLPRRVWYLAAVLLINRAGAMVIAYLTVYLTQERDFTTTRAGLVMAALGPAAWRATTWAATSTTASAPTTSSGSACSGRACSFSPAGRQ